MPIASAPSTPETQLPLTVAPVPASEIAAEPVHVELRSNSDATPFTGGYVGKNSFDQIDSPADTADTSRYDDNISRRKSRLPVLEIIVIVLLVLGAGAAFWMLRSSLPTKSVASAPNVDVTIAPTTAKVAVGKALDFTATVTGTDDVEVTWSVQEGDAGGQVVPRGAKAEGSGVSSLAVYVAPATPGTYHLLVASKADPQKSATAEITVAKGRK